MIWLSPLKGFWEPSWCIIAQSDILLVGFMSTINVIIRTSVRSPVTWACWPYFRFFTLPLGYYLPKSLLSKSQLDGASLDTYPLHTQAILVPSGPVCHMLLLPIDAGRRATAIFRPFWVLIGKPRRRSATSSAVPQVVMGDGVYSKVLGLLKRFNWYPRVVDVGFVKSKPPIGEKLAIRKGTKIFMGFWLY